MHRDLTEVLRSQQIMLGKNPENYPMRLAESFKNELKRLLIWEKKEPGVQMLHLHYTDVLNDPQKVSEELETFLGRELNIGEMLKVVDPELYRNRSVNEKA